LINNYSRKNYYRSISFDSNKKKSNKYAPFKEKENTENAFAVGAGSGILVSCLSLALIKKPLYSTGLGLITAIWGFFLAKSYGLISNSNEYGRNMNISNAQRALMMSRKKQ